MKRRRYNLPCARDWYLTSREALTRVPLTSSWPNRDVEAFVAALVLSLLPTSTVLFPDTFNLDADRLRVLKAELQDLMHENICCQILIRLVAKRSRVEHATEEALVNFRSDLQKLMGDGRFLALPTGNISAELVRHALKLSGSNTECDAELSDLAEEWLQHARSNPDTQRKHAEDLMADLVRDVFACVEKYLSSSPWDIFNALVAPVTTIQPGTVPSITPGASTASHRPSRRTDLIHRITHIAVLHWRIWENIVYNNEDIERTAITPSQTAAALGTFSRSPTPKVENAAPMLTIPTTADPVATNSSAGDLDQPPSESRNTKTIAFP
jgi:hypothetical protein